MRRLTPALALLGLAALPACGVPLADPPPAPDASVEPDAVRAPEAGPAAGAEAGPPAASGFAEGAIPPPPEAIAGKLDALFKSYLSYKVFTGASLALILDGKPYHYGVGKTALAGGKTPDPDTVYEIGSVTKTFLALAVAGLLFEKKLALEDPLESHLPGAFHLPKRGSAAITLRHAVTHTSGLPMIPTDLSYSLFDPNDLWVKLVAYDRSAASSYLGKHNLTRDPGALFEYSNFAALLGLVLESVEKTPWDEVIAARVSKPLGLRDTTLSLSPEQESRLSEGYLPLLGSPIKPGQWKEGSFFAPVGALKSTARDLLKYLAANLGLHPTPIEGAIALSHATLFDARGKAAAPTGLLESISQPKIDEVGVLWWKTALKSPKDLLTIGHIGAMGGFMTVISFNRERRTGFVLLLNSRNWAPETLSSEIWKLIL